MPNRTEARSAKAALTNATGRLPLLRLFSTPPMLAGTAGQSDGSKPAWVMSVVSKSRFFVLDEICHIWHIREVR